MPFQQQSAELSSVDSLARILFLAFLFILTLQVLPKEIELDAVRSQTDFNELSELSGELRALSQRIAFMALGRIISKNPKLVSSLDQRIEVALEDFSKKSTYLLSILARNPRFSQQVKEYFLVGARPLGQVLDRFGSSARLVSGEFEDGLDDIDFLLLLATTTADTYTELGQFSTRVSKEAERSFQRYVLLKDALTIASIVCLLGVGIYVIFYLPNRIRSELRLRFESEQALKLQLNELERFSSVVAHDLRGPLHNIHGAGSLLTERLDSQRDDQSLELTEIITQQSERLSRMIGELLAFARSQSNRIGKQRVMLSEIVGRAKERLKLEIERRAVSVKVMSDIRLAVDPLLFEGVFQNLIENSLKYAEVDHLEIAISGQVNKRNFGATEIVYRDNGVGIAENIAPTIFEPFVQGTRIDSTPSSTPLLKDGVGLGLSFVRQVVQRHGGRIEVFSAKPKGAEFRIFLPKS